LEYSKIAATPLSDDSNSKEKIMGEIRRSWLIIPADRPEELAKARENPPDVLVLDLEYTVPPKSKEKARNAINGDIHSLYRAFPDLFVRVDWKARWADVRAAIYPSLKGFIFPGPETVDEIKELDELVGRLEHERGVVPGSLEFVLMLESAKGFWNAIDLVQSSPRVTALGVGRIDLTMEPSGEVRLARFLMSRTLLAARANDIQPLGAHFIAGSRGGVASYEATLKAVREGWQMGFTGYIAATPEQVAALNEGFTPSAGYAKKAEDVLKSYTADDALNVEVNGQNWDIFKAERLNDIIADAEACKVYDKEKKEAIKQVMKC
jgi:citrate lyase subunit beta/citryl-CoA lyase